MRNLARWTIFTAATTFVWLAGGFLYLVLSRHYPTLQLPTIMLTLMFTMAAATAVAAIAYASKLDDEVDPDAAVLSARRARELAASQPRQR